MKNIFGFFGKKHNTQSLPGNPSPIINQGKLITWPIHQERLSLKWFPARQRLIGLVRGNRESFILPPAVVRKASWRD